MRPILRLAEAEDRIIALKLEVNTISFPWLVNPLRSLTL
jgi:hypothetical protein